MAIIAKAEVRADSDIESAVVTLKIGGITASESAGAKLAGGERYDFLLLAAVNPGTSASVALSMGGADCTLLSCQIVVSGENAGLSRGDGDCAVDKCDGGKWITVACADDDVTAYVFDEQSPLVLGEPLHIGAGRGKLVRRGLRR